MTTFWDSLKTEVTERAVTLDSIWDNIPEQSLAELSSDCVHHFTIPTGARKVIGQCIKCSGEKWFKNYLKENTFNDKHKTAVQINAEQDMQSTDFNTLPEKV